MGRPTRTRTWNLRVWNPLLYQLSYQPENSEGVLPRSEQTLTLIFGNIGHDQYILASRMVAALQLLPIKTTRQMAPHGPAEDERFELPGQFPDRQFSRLMQLTTLPILQLLLLRSKSVYNIVRS